MREGGLNARKCPWTNFLLLDKQPVFIFQLILQLVGHTSSCFLGREIILFFHPVACMHVNQSAKSYGGWAMHDFMKQHPWC